ncbi:MAG: hypothetical protein ACK52W_04280 [Alphaproteobacteria bacterium]
MRNIKAARRNIGGHQNAAILVAESLNRPVALMLAQIAMNRFGLMLDGASLMSLTSYRAAPPRVINYTEIGLYFSSPSFCIILLH